MRYGYSSHAGPENRFLNEFFLYVLEDLHTCQSLCAPQFTSDDPTFVKHIVEGFYPLIPATATAPEMPPTRAFSRQLDAYIAGFLPVATYFRANDGRVSGVCDDQYTATLERLEDVPALGLPSNFRRGSLPAGLTTD